MRIMRNVTLVLLFREINGERLVCLAMKKRGFGAERPNGYGGKVNEADGETIEQAAVRELKEEANITARIKDLEKVAVVDFRFPEAKKDWNQRVHVFCAKKWLGEPKETEEMKPAWFNVKKIPFDKMWGADKHWLPLVLQGRKFKARVQYNEKQELEKFELLKGRKKNAKRKARVPLREVFRKSSGRRV